MELSLNVNVLGVREDDAWCAIALEMSLRGYGTTFEEALDALHRAIEAQVSFAVQHDTLDQVFIPADPHYFKLFPVDYSGSAKAISSGTRPPPTVSATYCRPFTR